MISSFRGKYSFLSNFYCCDVKYIDIIYKSAEAAFQASKSISGTERVKISRLNAIDAKKAGRKIILRKDWEKVKDRIMLNILYSKFSNTWLAKMLLDTKNEELIEGNIWGDRYWGVCNGTGKNMLGKLLMRVRDNI